MMRQPFFTDHCYALVSFNFQACSGPQREARGQRARTATASGSAGCKAPWSPAGRDIKIQSLGSERKYMKIAENSLGSLEGSFSAASKLIVARK